jgi:hypothetical protein
MSTLLGTFLLFRSKISHFLHSVASSDITTILTNVKSTRIADKFRYTVLYEHQATVFLAMGRPTEE